MQANYQPYKIRWIRLGRDERFFDNGDIIGCITVRTETLRPSLGLLCDMLHLLLEGGRCEQGFRLRIPVGTPCKQRICFSLGIELDKCLAWILAGIVPTDGLFDSKLVILIGMERVESLELCHQNVDCFGLVES